jgi:hypothetical protein
MCCFYFQNASSSSTFANPYSSLKTSFHITSYEKHCTCLLCVCVVVPYPLVYEVLKEESLVYSVVLLLPTPVPSREMGGLLADAQNICEGRGGGWVDGWMDGWMDALAILPVFSPGSQDLKVTVLRFS